jgi:hypothetical protein
MTYPSLKPDKVYFAFKRDASTDATAIQKLANAIVKIRLVSQWGHGGIVINGEMMHSTTTKGLHKLKQGEWSPEKWDLFETDLNALEVLKRFEARVGTAYDWFSLVAFVIPLARDSKRLYCFEWMWLASTGWNPNFRVAPEMLLSLIARKVQP